MARDHRFPVRIIRTRFLPKAHDGESIDDRSSKRTSPTRNIEMTPLGKVAA
jgi:hypothetical protein